ncbi:MAG TPA: hypothetical protein VEW07_07065 [Solirubrobacterales bacterium]|nr:hypothetical protein [Solirubrobacterales bacterium]
MSARGAVGRLAALALIVLCLAPVSAHAGLSFGPGDVTLEAVDAAGEPETRAGAHPDRLIQSFKFTDTGGATEHIKDIAVDLPVGFGGDPGAAPPCPRASILNPLGAFLGCPAESQVGTLGSDPESTPSPLYVTEPGPDEVATFVAILSYKAAITFSGHLRPSDQGLSLYATDLTRSSEALGEGTIELWGVPADHQTGTSIPREPFLTLPTHCRPDPLTVTVRIRTWEHPDRWVSGQGGQGPPLTGCGDLGFAPRLGFALDNPKADAPSGARIDLEVPQNNNPDERATAQIEDVSVELPSGTTFSLAGAAGLRSCSDRQLGLGSSAPPACPAASRVGTVTMGVATLDKPMSGGIYLGEERPGDRFRLFLTARAMGADIKFAGSLHADPATGLLTASMRDLPQAALESLTLQLDGGPGSLLATPLACGPAQTRARFTPYSGGAPIAATATVSVAGPTGANCAAAAPFQPSFTGGSTNRRAGRPTTFTATVRRRDGEQLPQRLAVSLPLGMSAAVGSVAQCPAAAVGAGACPLSSRIGGTVAELGPGANPTPMQGDVYLTEPYRRAPFGLALVFRATIGPFDLGRLVVRGTMRVDPQTGQVRVETDPLPTVFEGISVRFQTIGLDIDRPGFLRNPTSCAPGVVAGTLRSVSGAAAALSSPFRVRECVELPFRPSFSVALTNRSQLHRGGRPGLRIAARVPGGNANLRTVGVALPGLLRFDPSGLREICARRQALESNCPRGARVGSGFARTPLLKGPLQGAVYVVQPRGSGPPDLWTILDSAGIRFNLRAETTIVERRVRTELVDLPDFPLASFAMRLGGGKHGIFELTTAPCGPLVAPLALTAQSGVQQQHRAPLRVPGGCRRDG